MPHIDNLELQWYQVRNISYLELVATLMDTLFQALLADVEILSRKKKRAFAPPTALIQNVSDVCNGIDKMSMKSIFQAATRVNISVAQGLYVNV